MEKTLAEIERLQGIQKVNRFGSPAWVAAHLLLQPLFPVMARAHGQAEPAPCDCDHCWSNAVAAADVRNGATYCSRCSQLMSGDIDRDAAGKPLCWSGCRGGRGPHSTAETTA